MGGQAGQKFECNDKHIDIHDRLRESRRNTFTRLPPTYREIVMGKIIKLRSVMLCILIL